MSKKMTQAEFIAKAVAVHGVGRYDYGRVAYVASAQKVIITCLKHGGFEQTPNSHLGGRGCLKCSYEERGTAQKHSQGEFVTKARAIHGDKYDYGRVVYEISLKKVIITCPTHGDFEQVPSSHLSGRGCPSCASLLVGHLHRGDTASFITKAHTIHGDKYNYGRVVYKASAVKVIISCPTHGDFEQAPSFHLQGQGCAHCGAKKGVENRRSIRNRRSSQGEFVTKARAIHGDKYDYGRVVYVSALKKVTITCPTHGDFEQTPNVHLGGSGCSGCRSVLIGNLNRGDTASFITKARAIHGDKYDYGRVVYEASLKKVIITCPTHGDFEQTPSGHLSGNGCQVCARALTKDAQQQSWVERAGGRECILYFIHIYSKDESFYKVGITYHSLRRRFQGAALPSCYQYESLAVHKSTNATRIWEWEQSILESFAHLRYTPASSFIGQSECFSSREEILAAFPL
jgi:hypothetical protein